MFTTFIMNISGRREFLAAALILAALSWPCAAQNEEQEPARERVTDQDEQPQTRESDRVTDRDPRRFRRRDRAAAFVPPPDIQMAGDVVYATAANDDGSPHELMMNIFFPKQSGDAPLPAIIYIHGGGWSEGSREMGNQLSAFLARGGYLTATIDYRLTGDAKFPACLHDCKAAVRFLRANAEELGIDPARIGAWGHSAGGHLASFLGTSGNNPETDGDVGEFDEASAGVAAVVDFFGPADLTELFGEGRGERMRRQLFAAIDEATLRKDAETASPITWIDAGDPPVLIIHGMEDRLVPIGQSVKFEQVLREAGVEVELVQVEGAGHTIEDPEYLIRAAKFFDDKLGGKAEASLREVIERMRAEQDLRRRRYEEARRERARQPDRQQDETPDDDGDDD